METKQITSNDLRYLEVLKDLHEITENGASISLSGFLKENSINLNICQILVKKKILKKEGDTYRPIYTWNTIKPNINMVQALKTESASMSKNRNIQATTSELKYLDALNSLYNKTIFPAKINIEEFRTNWRINNYVPTILIKRNILTKIGDNKFTCKYQWNSTKPTLKLVRLIKKDILERNRHYYNVSINKRAKEINDNIDLFTEVENIEPASASEIKTPKRIKTKAEKEVNIVEIPSKKEKHIKILWGLINIKINE